MIKNILSDKEFNSFQENGFLIKENFFKNQEINKINNTLKKDHNFNNFYNKDTIIDGNQNIIVWNEPGSDILGITSRLEKVVGAMEQLMYDEVYHYHSKITDVPINGSGWLWHQDYGYWYQNSCLFPDMASIFIPLDPCYVENGCLQIISKSHKLGRINHIQVEKGSLTIDQERLRHILSNLERIDCILNIGDVLFTHCDLLHASNKNTSGKNRRTLICCYNTKHNNPVKEHHHPLYKPIKKLPDESILEINEFKFTNSNEFLNNQLEKYPTLN